MTNAFSQRPEDYYASAAAHFKDFSDFAKSQSIVAFDRITSLLNKHYFSELCILKMMMLSLGVLIGATFSDFLKKHRKFVVIAFMISVALFVYKIFQMFGEWDEENSSF